MALERLVAESIAFTHHTYLPGIVGILGATFVQLLPFTSHQLGTLPGVIPVIKYEIFFGLDYTLLINVSFFTLTTGNIVTVSITHGLLVNPVKVSKDLTQ